MVYSTDLYSGGQVLFFLMGCRDVLLLSPSSWAADTPMSWAGSHGSVLLNIQCAIRVELVHATQYKTLIETRIQPLGYFLCSFMQEASSSLLETLL